MQAPNWSERQRRPMRVVVVWRTKIFKQAPLARRGAQNDSDTARHPPFVAVPSLLPRATDEPISHSLGIDLPMPRIFLVKSTWRDAPHLKSSIRVPD